MELSETGDEMHLVIICAMHFHLYDACVVGVLPASAGVLLGLISSLSHRDVLVIFLVSVTINLLVILVAPKYAFAHAETVFRHSWSL